MTKRNWKKISRIIEKANDLREAALAAATKGLAKYQIEAVDFHGSGYAEPGYDDPESGVVATGNWNSITKWSEATHSFDTLDDAPGKLAKQLEALGVELEWSDEWTTCEGCQKLVRTVENSYRWVRSYWQAECGGVYCHECVRSNPRGYLSEYEGNAEKAVTLDLDLAKHGYVKVEQTFENGWYGGQDASPQRIAEALSKRGIKRFIFEITSKGQFDVDFVVHVHKSESKKLGGAALPEGECRADEDPAESLKRGLQAATLVHATVPAGEGVVVTKIMGDKVVSVKKVSPQDFVDGKALD